MGKAQKIKDVTEKYINNITNIYLNKGGSIKRVKMELISLKEISPESKVLLLKELGYASDGEFVLDLNGNKILDRYLGISIKIENMVIFPGSEIILDDNELSISKYLEEFGDVL